VIIITGKNRRTGYSYTNNQLQDFFRGKALKLRRPPSKREIDADPELPSYSTYLRRFGGKTNICNILQIDNIPADIHRQLCQDCTFNPISCNQDPFDCASQANLYYRSTNSRKLI